MASRKSKYLSIQITELLMKSVGFWCEESKHEKWFLRGTMAYTVFNIGIAVFVQSADFLYNWGNIYAITNIACSTMPVMVVWIKLTVFIVRKKEILNLIKYTQDNFWFGEYDAYGEEVLQDINKKLLILMGTFTFFVLGTGLAYLVTPIVENIGKNETDRIFPFPVRMDFPLTTTPYFEIIFTIQVFSLFHTGLCYCCFDNFSCILNMHVTGQFKILQYKLKSIFNSGGHSDCMSMNEKYDLHHEFRKCVVQHQSLIEYAMTLADLFKYTTLCQVLISSILLCVGGFQVFLAHGSLLRRAIFIAHSNAGFSQLFVITLIANELIIQSGSIADAAYGSNWQYASPENDKRNVRHGLLLVMKRANRPCQITAGGFFPVSLETFMSVLSTAASYFTVLRNFEIDVDDD